MVFFSPNVEYWWFQKKKRIWDTFAILKHLTRGELISRRSRKWVCLYLDLFFASVFGLKLFSTLTFRLPFSILKSIWKNCMLSRHLLHQDNLSLFLHGSVFLSRDQLLRFLLKATHQCFSCFTWKGIKGGNVRVIDYPISSPMIHLPPRPYWVQIGFSLYTQFKLIPTQLKLLILFNLIK